MNNQSQIELYQTEDGTSEVEVRFNQDSAWLSIQQMSDLFGRDKSVISRNLKNIFESGELAKDATVAKNATVQIEGKRIVNREIEFFNLDAIISVGYRVNSKKGTQFRIWATQRLKELLVHGYTPNQQRFEQNSRELKQALKLIEKTAKSPELTLDAGRGLTEIVRRYTLTFLWLQIPRWSLFSIIRDFRSITRDFCSKTRHTRSNKCHTHSNTRHSREGGNLSWYLV